MVCQKTVVYKLVGVILERKYWLLFVSCTLCLYNSSSSLLSLALGRAKWLLLAMHHWWERGMVEGHCMQYWWERGTVGGALYTIDCGLCIHRSTCGCGSAVYRPLLIPSDHPVSMVICNKEHCTVILRVRNGMETWDEATPLVETSAPSAPFSLSLLSGPLHVPIQSVKTWPSINYCQGCVAFMKC